MSQEKMEYDTVLYLHLNWVVVEPSSSRPVTQLATFL